MKMREKFKRNSKPQTAFHLPTKRSPQSLSSPRRPERRSCRLDAAQRAWRRAWRRSGNYWRSWQCRPGLLGYSCALSGHCPHARSRLRSADAAAGILEVDPQHRLELFASRLGKKDFDVAASSGLGFPLCHNSQFEIQNHSNHSNFKFRFQGYKEKKKKKVSKIRITKEDFKSSNTLLANLAARRRQQQRQRGRQRQRRDQQWRLELPSRCPHLLSSVCRCRQMLWTSVILMLRRVSNSKSSGSLFSLPSILISVASQN